MNRNKETKETKDTIDSVRMLAEEKDIMTLKIVRKRPYQQSNNGQQVSEISHTARSSNLRFNTVKSDGLC